LPPPRVAVDATPRLLDAVTTMPSASSRRVRARRVLSTLLALAGVACLAAAAAAQTPPGDATRAQGTPAPQATPPASGAPAATASRAEPGTYRIDLHVRGVRNRSGLIRGGLYDGPRKWAEEPGSMAHCASPARTGDTICSFTIPARPGLYAAAFYHDENANDNFDTGFLGIPKEGWGFSRNPSVVLSKPSFASAAFRLPAPRIPVATLRY
jgi:uncharacterized protein (DUF2141 family)